MSHGHSLPRGGHAPGHIREAFLYAVQAFPLHWPSALLDEEAIDWYDDDRTTWWAGLTAEDRARWLTGQLWNCTDIVPSGDCADLDLPLGSTYAQAVRSIRAAGRA